MKKKISIAQMVISIVLETTDSLVKFFHYSVNILSGSHIILLGINGVAFNFYIPYKNNR